jgi:hypothetical protein
LSDGGDSDGGLAQADAGEVAGDAGRPDAGTSSDAGSPSPCKGLDERSCLERTDCAAEYCFWCSCEQRFFGCRAVSAKASPCPLLECPSPMCCRSPAECGDAVSCRAPGALALCGACNPDPATCAFDTDCAPGEICAAVPCSCSGMGTRCVAGCGSDDACPLGESCSTALRCEPSACAKGCPPLFECSPGAQRCQRKVCSADDECAGGFCVERLCHRGLGVCEAPAP